MDIKLDEEHARTIAAELYKIFDREPDIEKKISYLERKELQLKSEGFPGGLHPILETVILMMRREVEGDDWRPEEYLEYIRNNGYGIVDPHGVMKRATGLFPRLDNSGAFNILDSYAVIGFLRLNGNNAYEAMPIPPKN